MSPAVVAASSSQSSSKDATKSTRHADAAHAQPRPRRRVVRRRGRGRRDSMGSDDEIERETMSDASDSEPSLMDSASDSEVESESESLALRNGRHHLDTPSTTQSPPPGEVESAAALNGFAALKPDGDANEALQHPRSAPAFLDPAVTWSDMVTSEGVNGDAQLPVIDFTELHEHATSEPPHLTNQEDATGSVASGTGKEKEDDSSTQQGNERPSRGGPVRSRGAPRLTGQAARQAYQERLQNDPSFVPTVGEFWGHDDRLLDRNLRSLSGWWRGRWQGRGRGRGGFIGRGMRGRGRGGFFGGYRPAPKDEEAPAEPEDSSDAVEGAPNVNPELPPIEKAWTHDGFEEMKAREERRRALEQRKAKNRPASRNSAINATAGPSRGGFVPRGRGSFRNVSSPTSSRGGSSFAQRLRSQPDRPWYTMKPEHVWTKQFEGFLYAEPSLRPKHGKPAGFRVSLPGKGSEIVRVPAPQKAMDEVSGLRSQPPSEMTASTDAGSRMVVVNLPRPSAGKDAEESFVQPEPITTVEDLPSDAAPIPEPPSVEQPAVPDPQPSGLESSITLPQPPTQDNAVSTPALTRESSLSDRSVADASGITDGTAQLTLEEEKAAPDMAPAMPGPMPPRIQTSFPPPVQPTPAYASSPYAYPPSLPPGIALNQQGYAYEVASGRPVYLQPTPPPPQMHIFNPRPIPFVPGHMHHHSLSGEYMQAPPTPTLGGIVDPSTGQPIFALPRQNSRIEIRAPTDTSDGQFRVKQMERRPSSLRSSTTAEVNGETHHQQSASMSYGAQQYPPGPVYYQPEMMNGMGPQPTYQVSEGAASLSPGSEEPPHVQPAGMDPSMMGYAPYQQQYYYPEQYYPAYVEMPQQHGQYDPYHTDPHQQPPVYY